MDEEVSCPRCKTTKYRNPNLKLLVNVCGHTLCENCVELLFVRGSGTCPECNINLRRTNFRIQFFEDASIEKEIEIRKRILKDYNLKEDNFTTLREYNDYLEEVETIIFNLVNNVDVEETKKKVESHKRENKDQIQHNKFKKSADELFIEECLAVERANKANYTGISEEVKLQAKEKLERQRNQQLLIENLMYSDASASEILQSHQEVQKLKEQDALEKTKAQPKPAPAKAYASNLGNQTTFMPIPKKVEVLYKYEEYKVNYLGPAPPNLDDVKHKGYLRNMRAETSAERAGGYESYMGCMKALQSAVEGLFLFEHDSAPSPAASNRASSSAGSSEGMDVSP